LPRRVREFHNSVPFLFLLAFAVGFRGPLSHRLQPCLTNSISNAEAFYWALRRKFEPALVTRREIHTFRVNLVSPLPNRHD
jgi:hypothetical protein